MNIFFIDECPKQSAKWLVDAHVTKMILETCQMLCTNFHLQGIQAPYKKTHANHPSTIWLRKSYDNMMWGLEHGYAIAHEFIERYGKRHKSMDILDWCNDNKHKLSFDVKDLTKFAIAIAPDTVCRTLPDFDENNPINCYRLYYQHDKKSIHKWKQNKPNWII